MLILSRFCLKNLKRESDFKITSTTLLRSNIRILRRTMSFCRVRWVTQSEKKERKWSL